MNVRELCGHLPRGRRVGLSFFALVVFAGMLHSPAYGQAAPAKTGDASSDDDEGKAAAVSLASTPEQRINEAWTLLTNAAGDAKHPQTRIQALAALGLMRSPRSEKMITDAMADPDLDVRTAAALAAGQTKDRNLTTNLRDLLDDKEPQVAFTAAVTLWKMNDKSGEDILMAVVDGDRSAGPTLMRGTEHSISRELHDPSAMGQEPIEVEGAGDRLLAQSHLVVALDDLSKVASLFNRVARGLLHDAIGLVAIQTRLDESKQH